MSFRESLRVLRIVEDQGAREIDVMGGEPLLLSWMPDFAKAASEKGMKVNISTNGSCGGHIARFKDSNPEKVTIGVSLEGSSEEKHNAITGSPNFRPAIEAIETIQTLGLDLAVKTVVSRSTAGDINNIAGLLRRLGAKCYYLIHMDVLTRDPALLNETFSYPDFKLFCENIKVANPDMEVSTVNASCFTKELIGHPVRCSGGVNKLSIMPDGSVFPCNLFHQSPEFRLGNILRDDFASIWLNPRLKSFRAPRGRACDDRLCTNRTSCTGGCPAHCHYHYGSLSGKDIRCEPYPAEG